MGAVFPSLLDRLLAALEAAQVALRSEHADQTVQGREALDESFAVLGALYATLDAGSHPELSDYLQTVYDRCLQRIGEARPGCCEGLTMAIVLLKQVRRAERVANEGQNRQSSRACAIAV